MTNLPAPPVQKRRVWPWVIVAVLGLAYLGNLLTDKPEATTAPITTVDPVESVSDPERDENLEIMRLIWDEILTSSERASICDFYNTPPVGVTREMVETFDSEAEMGYAESERVLTLLLAEKC